MASWGPLGSPGPPPVAAPHPAQAAAAAVAEATPQRCAGLQRCAERLHDAAQELPSEGLAGGTTLPAYPGVRTNFRPTANSQWCLTEKDCFSNTTRAAALNNV